MGPAFVIGSANHDYHSVRSSAVPQQWHGPHGPFAPSGNHESWQQTGLLTSEFADVGFDAVPPTDPNTTAFQAAADTDPPPDDETSPADPKPETAENPTVAGRAGGPLQRAMWWELANRAARNSVHWSDKADARAGTDLEETYRSRADREWAAYQAYTDLIAADLAREQSETAYESRRRTEIARTGQQDSVNHLKWIHVYDTDGEWLATFEYDRRSPEQAELAAMLARRTQAGVSVAKLGQILHEGLATGAEIGVRVSFDALDNIASAIEFYQDPSLRTGLAMLPGIPGVIKGGKKSKELVDAAKQFDNIPPTRAGLLDELALPKDAQRALLREALESNGTGKIAHHLIPLEALTKYESLMQRAARGGFDIKGKGNGVLLDAIDHVGGHPQYNRIVLEELGRINRQARRLSDSEVAELIQEAADELRRASDDGTFQPWF